MRNHLHSCFVLGVLASVPITVRSQITIEELAQQSALILPIGLLQGTIRTTGPLFQCIAVGTITDEQGLPILKVSSLPFDLVAGTTDLSMSPPALAAIHYSDTHKGMLLQTSGTLPYGRYEQCLEIIPGSGAEAGGQLCSSLISDEVDQFDLFYPYDGDSIPETRPVLNWTHTAPDQLATNVDAYELVLVHCEAPCNDPKAAVALENPVVLVHGLRTTTVPFPADAGDLRRGHEYAWQVQRWDAEQGFMIAATDVWKFKVMDRQPPREQRYAVLRHDMNGERYEANDRRVYFRFDEPYASSGLACTLYDNELRPLVPAVSTDGPTAERGKAGFAPKSNGPNLYEVDLQQFGSGTGYFILEVKDEKKRTYYLRIHAPR